MSLLPGEYDVTIYQGDQWTEHFLLETWSNYPTTPAVMVPEDLTNKIVKFQIRKTATSAVVLLSGSTLDGRVTIDLPATGGEISIVVDGDITKLLDFSCAVWDIETYTDPDNPETFLEGNVTLKKQVTR